MHDNLTLALKELARELKDSRQERRKQLVTKQDLNAAEARIVSAVKGVSMEEAEKLTAELRASSDSLGNAILRADPKESARVAKRLDERHDLSTD